MGQPQQRTVQSRIRGTIRVDGLEFRDLDGEGVLSPYEDWRLSPEERAADLVARMSPDEKFGLMVINSRSMGISQQDKGLTSHDGTLDEQYHRIKNDPHNTAGLPYEGTTQQIEQLHLRHFIMRETPAGSQIAAWTNAMNEVAEGTRWGIPVVVAANSKNELGGFKLGGTADDVDFTQWPGTLGLAATRDLETVRAFARHSREEWRASGLRKGYMYMADTATDPRWFRTNGTFGEDPAFIAQAIDVLVREFQDQEHADGCGLGPDGIAMTTKHFPGGGARENGFDPHYEEGQFNVYPTPGSLAQYHLPPFQAAIEAGTASIMPYYAVPSKEKSALPQEPLEDFEHVGFAFNTEVLRILREMGFTGYINSDSGILSKMAWGVQDLDTAQRAGRAIAAGTDLTADTNDVGSIREAFLRGYFSTSRLDEAARNLLVPMFRMGLFENPYVDPEEADRVVRNDAAQAAALEAHRKSVVLLKDQGVLPLDQEALAGKTVYVEVFEAGLEAADLDAFREELEAAHPGIAFTTDYRDADVAVLFLDPSTGDYFHATGLLDLQIHEDTNVRLAKVQRIREAVGTLVVAVNHKLAWIPENVEPLADVLLAGFDTRKDVVFEAVAGKFRPTGVLPLTLPADDAAVAVDAEGRCASPNDVPGYAKEQHMGGRKYAYTDAAGNRYVSGFGLGG